MAMKISSVAPVESVTCFADVFHFLIQKCLGLAYEGKFDEKDNAQPPSSPHKQPTVVSDSNSNAERNTEKAKSNVVLYFLKTQPSQPSPSFDPPTTESVLPNAHICEYFPILSNSTVYSIQIKTHDSDNGWVLKRKNNRWKLTIRILPHHNLHQTHNRLRRPRIKAVSIPNTSTVETELGKVSVYTKFQYGPNR